MQNRSGKAVARCITASVCASFFWLHAEEAFAYDIDCKLILCMAGGFPPTCADAKAYMISRITAFPPKPPIAFCAFAGGEYDNYLLRHGPLPFSPEMFECRAGLTLHAVPIGKEVDEVAFCYSSVVESCVPDNEASGAEVCTVEYIGQEPPLRDYEYVIDLTVEPNSDFEYRTGRILVDFDE